jgi:hypothetical protein
MMLAKCFPGQPGGEELLAGLRQRLQYLVSRAEDIAERAPDSAALKWQGSLAQATLWMEAAESAAALGEFQDARKCLVRGAELLLELKLPLGAALQRTFHLGGEDLSRSADRTMADWHAAISVPKSPDNKGAEPAQLDGAFETAQQWGYFVLAKAGTDTRKQESEGQISDDRERARGILAAPLGRLRLPLEDYFTVAEITEKAVRYRGDVQLRERSSAIEVIGKSLVGLYRILRYASANTYLWQRLLSPVPMFDLDTAIFTARLLEASSATETGWFDEHYADLLPTDAADYARAFVAAVNQMRRDAT